MVSDDPESFADLDGHLMAQTYQVANPAASGAWDPSGADSMSDMSGMTQEEFTSELALWYAQHPNYTPPEAAEAQNTSQTETQTQTQTQPKQLSAEDVSKAIQTAKDEPKGTPHAKTAVDFLNALGTNWNLSGDTLRQALKDRAP
jgi:hypothetical protein